MPRAGATGEPRRLARPRQRASHGDSYIAELIVHCQEGYTSSLAAAALRDLGPHKATDLAGDYAAWRAAGLPTTD
jgi:rhodanese-related sulfurtransferase